MSCILSKRFIFSSLIIWALSAQSASPKILQAIAYQLHGNQNAKECYQKLCHEAQTCAGFTTSQQLPLKKLDPKSKQYNHVAGCSCNGALFIQQDYLEKIKAPFGYLRIVIYHEVIHAKQFKKYGRFKVLNPQYQSIEKEADLEGAKLAQCWYCTACYANRCYDANDTSKNAHKVRHYGYATKQELLAIAQQQKSCHALCAYHKKQHTN